MLEVGIVLFKERFEGNDAEVFHPHIQGWIVLRTTYEFAFQISVLLLQVQMVAKLHIAQEVGNVENRKGVNEKYYFSILFCMRKN